MGGWPLAPLLLSLATTVLDILVGVSMIAMGLWTLKPDTLDEQAGGAGGKSAFVATLVAFFITEIGDKTQIATVALAPTVPPERKMRLALAPPFPV